MLPVDYDESSDASDIELPVEIENQNNESVELVSYDDIQNWPVPFEIIKPEKSANDGESQNVVPVVEKTADKITDCDKLLDISGISLADIADDGDEVELVNYDDVIGMPIPFHIIKTDNIEDVDAGGSTVKEKIDTASLNADAAPFAADVADLDCSDIEIVNIETIKEWPIPFDIVKVEARDVAAANDDTTASKGAVAAGDVAANSNNAEIGALSFTENNILYDDEFSGTLGYVKMTLHTKGKSYLGRSYAVEDRKIFLTDHVVSQLKCRTITGEVKEGIDFVCILLVNMIKGKYGSLEKRQVNPTVFRFIKYLYGKRMSKLASIDFDDPAASTVFNKICDEAFPKAAAIQSEKLKK